MFKLQANFSCKYCLKTSSKILANHLRPLLVKIIGPEQVDFMTGREARDNITKALNLIYSSCLNKIEGLLLSIGVVKAFDKVAWDYMFKTCKQTGLKTRCYTGSLPYIDPQPGKLK